jgi:flagellar biogenesis protein FliO
MFGVKTPAAPQGAHAGSIRGGWATWLAFGLFGLLASAAGLFAPGLGDPPAAPPLSGQVGTPDKASAAGGALEYTPPALPDFPSPGAMLLRLALGTAAVLALCVVTLVAARRFVRPPPAAGAAGQELRLIESLPLGGRCSVHLLQAGKTRALAGVDATGLKVLLALPETFAEALAHDAPGEEPAPREAA